MNIKSEPLSDSRSDSPSDSLEQEINDIIDCCKKIEVYVEKAEHDLKEICASLRKAISKRGLDRSNDNISRSPSSENRKKVDNLSYSEHQAKTPNETKPSDVSNDFASFPPFSGSLSTTQIVNHGGTINIHYNIYQAPSSPPNLAMPTSRVEQSENWHENKPVESESEENPGDTKRSTVSPSPSREVSEMSISTSLTPKSTVGLRIRQSQKRSKNTAPRNARSQSVEKPQSDKHATETGKCKGNPDIPASSSTSDLLANDPGARSIYAHFDRIASGLAVTGAQNEGQSNPVSLTPPSSESRKCRLCRNMFTDWSNVRQADGGAPCSFHPGVLENKSGNNTDYAFSCCGGPPVTVGPSLIAMNLVSPGCTKCYHQDKASAWDLETFKMKDPILFDERTPQGN